MPSNITGRNNTINVNTFSAGTATTISSSNNSQSSVSVKITQGTNAKSTLADTDVFLLEESDGTIKHITGSHIKSNVDTNHFTLNNNLLYPNNTSDNLIIGATSVDLSNQKLYVNGNTQISGIISAYGEVDGRGYINFYNAQKTKHLSLYPPNTMLTNGYNVILPNNASTLATTSLIETLTNKTLSTNSVWNGTRLTSAYVPTDIVYDADLLTASNFGTSATTNIQLGNSNGSVNKDLNIFSEDIFIGGGTTNTNTQHIHIVSGKSFNGETSVNIKAERQNDGNPQNTSINLTTSQGANNSGTSKIILNASHSNGSSGIGNIEMTAKSEIIMNTGLKINSSGTITSGTWSATAIPTGKIATTLTGKTLDNATFSSVPTVNATIRLNGGSGIPGKVDYYDIDGSNYIAIKGQDSLSSNFTLTLPAQTDTIATLGDTTANVASAVNVSTTSDVSNTTRTFGNSSCVADINGSSLSVPTSINTTPSGLTEGVLIKYDSGLGGGNGGMIFGTNSTGANGWETGIQAKQFIKMKCGSTDIAQFQVNPSNVKSIALKGATAIEDTLSITNGLISGSGDYLKWVVYNTNYRALESYCVVPSAPSAQQTTHFLLKNGEADYPSIKQNTAGSLYIHFENKGDRFEVSKDWDFGHAHAKFKYDNTAYTWFYDPSGVNQSASFAGSYFGFHNNGSVLYFNTTSSYNSGSGAGNTNYFSFAKQNDQQARITMNGIAQIADEWTDDDDPSDIRLKYDIKDYENATEVINKIKIKSFMKHKLKNFNNDENGNMLPFKDRLGEAKYSIGVIAQEIYEIPELKFMVRQSDFNDITPAYIKNWKPIISLLVKSNQEQQQQIDTLTSLVNTMKTTIDKLNNSATYKQFKS